MEFELFEFDKEIENNTSIIESRLIKRKTKLKANTFLKTENGNLKIKRKYGKNKREIIKYE